MYRFKLKESASRILLALEAVLLVLPLSLLYGVLMAYAFPDIVRSGSDFVPVMLAATLYAGAALIALWWLLIVAIARGVTALKSTHTAWLLVCSIAALWVVVAGVLLAAESCCMSLAPQWAGLILGIYGLPALLPYSHLLLERRLRRDVS